MNTLQMQTVLDSIDELRGRQIATAKAVQVLLTYHPEVTSVLRGEFAQMQVRGLELFPTEAQRMGVAAGARLLLP